MTYREAVDDTHSANFARRSGQPTRLNFGESKEREGLVEHRVAASKYIFRNQKSSLCVRAESKTEGRMVRRVA